MNKMKYDQERIKRKKTNQRREKKIGKHINDGSVATIYVGNLDYQRNEKKVKTMFEKFGKVTYVELSKTNRGVAFVQMPKFDSAEKAIKSLNNSQWDKRTLKVSMAKERFEKMPKVATKKVTEKDSEQKNRHKKKRTRGLKTLFNYLETK